MGYSEYPPEDVMQDFYREYHIPPEQQSDAAWEPLPDSHPAAADGADDDFPFYRAWWVKVGSGYVVRQGFTYPYHDTGTNDVYEYEDAAEEWLKEQEADLAEMRESGELGDGW